jgi:hypothetical protein
MVAVNDYLAQVYGGIGVYRRAEEDILSDEGDG